MEKLVVTQNGSKTSGSYRVFINLTLPAGRALNFNIESMFNSILVKMDLSSIKKKRSSIRDG